jgi:FixJ family two-component response regulator
MEVYYLMPRKQPKIACSTADRSTLTTWASSRTMEARLVERAKIILRCLAGDEVKDIAHDLDIRPNTVIDWRSSVRSGRYSGTI